MGGVTENSCPKPQTSRRLYITCIRIIRRVPRACVHACSFPAMCCSLTTPRGPTEKAGTAPQYALFPTRCALCTHHAVRELLQDSGGQADHGGVEERPRHRRHAALCRPGASVLRALCLRREQALSREFCSPVPEHQAREHARGGRGALSAHEERAQLLHPRQRGALCAAAAGRCGRGNPARRHPPRGPWRLSKARSTLISCGAVADAACCGGSGHGQRSAAVHAGTLEH